MVKPTEFWGASEVPTGDSQLGSESSEIAGLRVIAFNMRRPFLGAKAATLKALAAPPGAG